MKDNRILIVDDEPVIRATLVRELQVAGYDVSSCGAGQEAIELLQTDNFDVLITDLLLPDMDGISLLKISKAQNISILVIILTGYGDMASAIDALRLGADDYLTKPCDTDEIIHRIQFCIEKQKLLSQATYHQLKLAGEIERRRQAEHDLNLNEQRLQLALDAASDGVWDRNLLTHQSYYGENWHRSLGYSDEEAIFDDASWEALLHPDDKEKVLRARKEHSEGMVDKYEIQYRMRNKQGNWQWILSRGKVIARDKRGKPLRIIGTHTNITPLKEVQTELEEARSELENRVRERTAELEEINVALNTLLKKREKDRQVVQQQVLDNINTLVQPYVEKLRTILATPEQHMYLNILEANLGELSSSMAHTISIKFSRLTPTEIQVANLVKMGKRSKEIADVLNLSPGTINIHRKNIRKKLEITNTRVNLQTVLSTLS
ncbi:response regulator [Desulfogranum japonicum]|uniref:response regulator n=1 Tax=Desulfogranum japonicum TaxID=231447 RepID=UPI00041D633A|nr:response regulator [Desulfogranum japonicum]